MFNVPPAVAGTLGVMALIHAVRIWALSPRQDTAFLLYFAFIPARYDGGLVQGAAPGGWGADVWTFVTYALIHGDMTHLGLNAVWLLAFGSAVARRFGSARFLAFSAITAAGGAALHLATHPGEFLPMVGASASISGFMAAAMRFMFQPPRRVDAFGSRPTALHELPAAPLPVTLRDSRVLGFLGVWFVLNLVFGLGSFAVLGSEQSVAWQAHMGGFLTGMLLFALFDPVPNRSGVADDDRGTGDKHATLP